MFHSVRLFIAGCALPRLGFPNRREGWARSTTSTTFIRSLIPLKRKYQSSSVSCSSPCSLRRSSRW